MHGEVLPMYRDHGAMHGEDQAMGGDSLPGPVEALEKGGEYGPRHLEPVPMSVEARPPDEAKESLAQQTAFFGLRSRVSFNRNVRRYGSIPLPV